MDNLVLEKINLWKNNVKESDRSLINKMSEEELIDAFSTDMTFGTGGLRGVIGIGSNRMNEYIIKKSTLGFGKYLLDKEVGALNRGVVISYDCRRFSKEFATHAALVLINLGYKVYIFSSLRSTPELSFAVRYFNCAGGIMITASHNPPMYNGYKVYDSTGCQLVPKDAEMLINYINNISDMFNITESDLDDSINDNKLIIVDKEVDDAFINEVKSVKVQDTIRGNIKIVYSPLHGTGSNLMVPMLKEEGYNVYPVEEQMIPDGEFSTLISPNPEEPTAFEYAIKLGNKIDADILIATDPDADRMGIAAKNKYGEYQLLTGNQTGAILLNYLAKYKKHGDNSYAFNTIVTSDIAKEICKKHNLHLIQTLTGFKFIGEQANIIEKDNKEFFFGYEESYGYVIKGYVRDKDSFQATHLLCEVASFYKSINKTLIDALDDVYKEYGYYLEGAKSLTLTGVEGAARIKRIMKYFQEHPLDTIANHKIDVIEDYELGISKCKDQTTVLTLPKTSVLKYIFEGGGWFALRPSGTEPKIKFYIAIKDKDYESAKLFVQELIDSLMKIVDIIE